MTKAFKFDEQSRARVIHRICEVQSILVICNAFAMHKFFGFGIKVGKRRREGYEKGEYGDE
jgi:hypothetical protein